MVHSSDPRSTPPSNHPCASLCPTLLGETVARRPRISLPGRKKDAEAEKPGGEQAPATATSKSPTTLSRTPKVVGEAPTTFRRGTSSTPSNRTSGCRRRRRRRRRRKRNRRGRLLPVPASPPFRVVTAAKAVALVWKLCRRRAPMLVPDVVVPRSNKGAGARWSPAATGFEIRGCRRRAVAIQGVRGATRRLPPARDRGAGIVQGVVERRLSMTGDG